MKRSRRPPSIIGPSTGICALALAVPAGAAIHAASGGPPPAPHPAVEQQASVSHPSFHVQAAPVPEHHAVVRVEHVRAEAHGGVGHREVAVGRHYSSPPRPPRTARRGLPVRPVHQLRGYARPRRIHVGAGLHGRHGVKRVTNPSLGAAVGSALRHARAVLHRRIAPRRHDNGEGHSRRHEGDGAVNAFRHGLARGACDESCASRCHGDCGRSDEAGVPFTFPFPSPGESDAGNSFPTEPGIPAPTPATTPPLSNPGPGNRGGGGPVATRQAVLGPAGTTSLLSALSSPVRTGGASGGTGPLAPGAFGALSPTPGLLIPAGALPAGATGATGGPGTGGAGTGATATGPVAARTGANGTTTNKSHPGSRQQRPTATPVLPKPSIVERFVGVIPPGIWVALLASMTLAAAGATAAFRTARRANVQAGQMAAVAAAAMTDPLTGVLNRRGFMEAAERELARASRYNRPFALAYVDVRGLKAVNDTEGHLAGDQLLTTAANLLKDSARAGDVIGRIGGDELGLLLTEQSAMGAAAALQRIKSAVPAHREAMGLRAPWDLTIGMAVFPHDGQTLEQLLAAADRRLYQQRGIDLH